MCSTAPHFTARRLCLFLTLFPVLIGAGVMDAQTPPASNAQVESGRDDSEAGPSALVILDMDGDGPAKVTLEFDSILEKEFNLQRVLSTSLGCQLEDISFSRYERNQSSTLYAECDIPLRRSLLTHAGTMDLSPFQNIWKAEPKFSLVLTLRVPKSDSIRFDPPPEKWLQNPSNATCLYFFNDPSQTPAALQFEFGYSRPHAARLLTLLTSLLLVPVLFTLWFRKRALAASDEAKPAVSFAYRRFLMWTALFGVLVWWATVDLLHADEFVKFILPSSKLVDAFALIVVPWVLLWTPPLLVYFLCLALSGPIQTLRGTKLTQKQIANRSFWALARIALPLTFVCLGVVELFNSPRLSVFFIAAGIVAGKFATGRFVRAYGVELQALTSGELRDRAFAIAQQAKTRLNQLYVMPTEHIRMANAFAHAAQNVFLTDYLVKNLSKAEVDAIVGHEIAHLQNRHLRRRITVVLLAVFLFAFGAAFSEHWLPRQLPSGPIFYALLLLTLLFISRRNEFAADAGSVKLTGNGEAMMTALARVTRLNTVPMQWGKLDEKLLTHPSTLRRIKRLAKTGGISEARTAELLGQSLAPPADTYPIPPSALPGGKLFSTRYKAKLASKFGWTVILTTAILPAIAAFLADSLHLVDQTRWFAYALGFLSTLAANLVLLNFLPMLGLAKMERLLGEKCRLAHPASGECNRLFVSLAPSSEPLIYEGNWAWDLGFLSITGERLSYWGEETSFVLRRSEITAISIGPGPTGWFRTRAVYLSWRDSAGLEGVFNLRPLRARSMREMAAQTHLFARDLQNWHQGLPAAATPILRPAENFDESAGPPSFGNVTGVSPKAVGRGHLLVRDFLVNTFLAVGSILVFGLGFPPFDDLRGRLDPTPNPSYSGLYVLAVVWLVRVFVLLPFWRTPAKNSWHKPPSSTAAPVSSALRD